MIDFSLYAPQNMFLIQGDEASFDELVASIVPTEPLVQALSVPRFTMDHARTVAEFATEGTGENRTYIIYFSVFSPEAAQVLLKSLEEPAQGTRIVFVTRYPYLVPQTVRSRLMIVESGHLKGEGTKKTTDILKAIQKEAAEKDDDAAVRRSRAVVLLDELEQSLYSEVRPRFRDVDTIYQAKAMLFKANMPTKFVLDYVATVVR